MFKNINENQPVIIKCTGFWVKRAMICKYDGEVLPQQHIEFSIKGLQFICFGGSGQTCPKKSLICPKTYEEGIFQIKRVRNSMTMQL